MQACRITNVTIGGSAKWYMLGHTFWSEEFSRDFIRILTDIYDREEIRDKLWESIYIEHLDELPMKIRKYPAGQIYEFDTLDELRIFDSKYCNYSGSKIMEETAQHMNCMESEITALKPMQDKAGKVFGFTFLCRGKTYCYHYDDSKALIRSNAIGKLPHFR